MIACKYAAASEGAESLYVRVCSQATEKDNAASVRVALGYVFDGWSSASVDAANVIGVAVYEN